MICKMNRSIIYDQKEILTQSSEYENASIIWAFENFQYQKEGIKSIKAVLNNSSVNLNISSGFNTSKLTVYLIKYA